MTEDAKPLGKKQRCLALFALLFGTSFTHSLLRIPRSPDNQIAVMPDYDRLPVKAKSILEDSTYRMDLSPHDGAKEDYNALDLTHKEGLLNLVSAMRNHKLSDGKTILDHIIEIKRIDQDRLFIMPDQELLGLVLQSPNFRQRSNFLAEIFHRPQGQSKPYGQVDLVDFKDTNYSGGEELAFTVLKRPGLNTISLMVETDIDLHSQDIPSGQALLHGYECADNHLHHKLTDPVRAWQYETAMGMPMLYSLMPRKAVAQRESPKN